LATGDALGKPTVGTFVKGGTADWLVVTEAIRGTDVYAPVDELAEKWIDLTNVNPSTPHPRPPSAITLLLPLAGVPDDLVIGVIAAVMAVSLVLFVDEVLAWSGLSPRASWFVAVLLASSAAMMQGALWGTHIPLVALCCGPFAFGSRTARSALGGLLGGVAVGLKLFPALLVGTHAKENPKRVGLVVLSFIFVTLAGLALPGVGWSGAVAAIGGASSAYGDSKFDMSLAAQLGVSGRPIALVIPAVAVCLLPLLWKLEDRHIRTALASVVMLLAAPIAWPEYQLLALPAAVLLWTRHSLGRIAAVGWAVVLVTSLDGRLHFAALVGLALALVIEAIRNYRRSIHPPEPSATTLNHLGLDIGR
jgi:hypothetical protein